ncbi:MAG: antibiotic biosynthesis monooxygenase family protein [Solirubrobacteraceae bacterium]|jgi:heme-degrading monooxygenase HmoA
MIDLLRLVGCDAPSGRSDRREALDNIDLADSRAGVPCTLDDAGHVSRIESDSAPATRPRSREPLEPEHMYISMSHLRLEESQVTDLLEAFSNRIRLVDHADGFIDLEVWHSDRDPGEVIMVSRWQTREAFTRYMKSDDHAASHARIGPTLKQAIRLERLDHLHTYHVVAR